MYTLVMVTPRNSISESASVVNVVENAPIANAVCSRISGMIQTPFVCGDCTGLPSCDFKVTGTGTRYVVPLCEEDTFISPAAKAPYFPSCCGLLFAMFSSWCIRVSWAMSTCDWFVVKGVVVRQDSKVSMFRFRDLSIF